MGLCSCSTPFLLYLRVWLGLIVSRREPTGPGLVSSRRKGLSGTKPGQICLRIYMIIGWPATGWLGGGRMRLSAVVGGGPHPIFLPPEIAEGIGSPLPCERSAGSPGRRSPSPPCAGRSRPGRRGVRMRLFETQSRRDACAPSTCSHFHALSNDSSEPATFLLLGHSKTHKRRP